AYRIACRAKVDRVQRSAKGSDLDLLGVGAAEDPASDLTWRELQTALHEELQRLPQHYRTPLILCYLGGKTQDEAARQLGWSNGALRGRLDRGRELLRQRLTRRGLALSAAAFVAMLSQNSMFASMPALLVVSTVKAAMRLAGAPDAAPAGAAGLKGLLAGKLRGGMVAIGACLI